ncbi:MAG TPA: FtsQ-type POTRA domain-containing protein [Bryobacteraceae bacterium]|nr:FtsQ-type POTRA domain-containing protein [Bryobacteraceae bacterium]
MARDKKHPQPIRWRLWLSAGVFVAIAGSTAFAAVKVREHVLSDPTYLFSRDNKEALLIQGMVYTPRSKVMRVFASDFGHSVFAIPLDERRRRLLAIDWVEDASVARIWPDRLIVRLRERKPVAFVFFRSGVTLIDRHGMLLDQPPQSQFTFPVLSGVREDETEDQRAEHVRAMLHVQEDLGYLAKDVSEIDARDPDNIRIVAKAGNRAVELTLGDSNFASRYQNFLAHFAEIDKHSPGVRSFDLRMDDRITAKESEPPAAPKPASRAAAKAVKPGTKPAAKK